MQLKYSIVIPTLKRPESVVRLLRSLESQVRDEGEIIVVEQSVSHKHQIQSALSRFIHHRYLYLAQKGTVSAIIHGILAARGEVLLFFDDDVVVNKSTVRNHLLQYADDMIGSVVGRVLTENPKQLNIREVGRISPWATFGDGYESNVRQEAESAIGCNWSIRTALYHRVGGFDPNFWGIALRFEADMSIRIREAGYKIVFEPEASVRHLRAERGGSRKSEGRIEWYFNFFSNETYFFMKHRPHFLFPLFVASRVQWMLRCMFGFGREVSLRSLTTPFKGIGDGIGLYRLYKKSL